jgi:phospholipase C
MLLPALATAAATVVALEAAPARPRRPLRGGGIGKIEHFVVLYMENRPFDHFFGCMDLPGADSAATMTRNRTLYKDPTDHSKGSVNVTCGTAEYVCGKRGGMHYNLFSGKFHGGNDARFPYSAQSDDFSYGNGAYDESIEMFAPSQLPVKAAIAREFGVFNKLYSSVPSASTPNHLFTQSATSCGIADNILYSQCDGPNATFPQVTPDTARTMPSACVPRRGPMCYTLSNHTW